MDCIEGLHCGVGYPNPDNTPTLCLEAPATKWDIPDEYEPWGQFREVEAVIELTAEQVDDLDEVW
jgi:hypothetical protein